MKTTILFLLLAVVANSQNKYTSTNFIIDHSLHVGVDIERVEKTWYAKTFFEYAPNIDGDYKVLGGAVGWSKQFGMFDNFRFYTAPKIQFIKRGGNTYPSYGVELGVDKILDSGLILGIKGSYDYRTDFDFWGGKSEFRPSVFVKVGVILN